MNPVSPGLGYVWLDGYWYPSNNRYLWHNGYWTRPPYKGANWANPRYDGEQYYGGYWSGGNRQVPHNHRWDNNKRNRDYNEGRGNRR